MNTSASPLPLIFPRVAYPLGEHLLKTWYRQSAAEFRMAIRLEVASCRKAFPQRPNGYYPCIRTSMAGGENSQGSGMVVRGIHDNGDITKVEWRFTKARPATSRRGAPLCRLAGVWQCDEPPSVDLLELAQYTPKQCEEFHSRFERIRTLAYNYQLLKMTWTSIIDESEKEDRRQATRYSGFGWEPSPFAGLLTQGGRVDPQQIERQVQAFVEQTIPTTILPRLASITDKESLIIDHGLVTFYRLRRGQIRLALSATADFCKRKFGRVRGQFLPCLRKGRWAPIEGRATGILRNERRDDRPFQDMRIRRSGLIDVKGTKVQIWTDDWRSRSSTPSVDMLMPANNFSRPLCVHLREMLELANNLYVDYLTLECTMRKWLEIGEAHHRIYNVMCDDYRWTTSAFINLPTIKEAGIRRRKSRMQEETDTGHWFHDDGQATDNAVAG